MCIIFACYLKLMVFIMHNLVVIENRKQESEIVADYLEVTDRYLLIVNANSEIKNVMYMLII